MKCDLHVHTRFSYDTNSSPKEVVEAAIKNGIDCLAITDHNEVQGALEAEKYAADKSVLIIPGIEVKSRQGDILGLNVRQLIPKNLSAKETIRRIKEVGGMAIIAHPFGDWHPFLGDLRSLIDKIDGIEVLNASIFRGNKKALKLVRKYNLPFTAGSDAHHPKFVGRAYLEIPGQNLSVKEILKAIKNRNCRLCSEKLSFSEKLTERTNRGLIRLSRILRNFLK